uniref:Uncharacterized protein n=1 Tax=Alexandrium catenella TaxID=2925 RepID=A0A7S1QIW9_ALECA|mmetsp:Transcript_33137/g.89715  ORF Transcript_33137/g.89715 Transcript_33137/m.89715 type:complete len:294 (+) Transcript_33137:80-961(+)
MIYIFNFFRDICGLPGRLCTECGKLCDQCHCTICQEACVSLSGCCSNFLDKPLASYVVISGLMSLFEIALCVSSMNARSLGGCRGTSHALGVGIRSWLVVQIGFAGLNLLFAPYFQGRVWENLKDKVQSMGAGTRGTIGKDVVQSSFKDVFLHDFGVLFYFFALIASFFWSVNGANFAQNHGLYCNPDGMVAWAASIGSSLFWVAILYSLTWYWCSCCAKSVNPEKLRLDIEARPAVPAYPVAAGREGASPSQALYYSGGGRGGTQGNLVQPPAGPQYMPVAQGQVVRPGSKR